jgi:hypothetical protein
MNEHGAHYIIEGTKYLFCFAALRGSIVARHSQQDDFAGEEVVAMLTNPVLLSAWKHLGRELNWLWV